jgi:zinc-ribbon domain
MTNSATSTDRAATENAPPAPAFQPWHFFLLLGMAGATVAVMMSRETHPAALLLLSAAVVCAGLVGLAVHRTVSAFFGRGREAEPLPPHSREQLLREKAMTLRSIKELEFDHAMGKVSDADFAAISSNLRARALALMDVLQRDAEKSGRTPAVKTPAVQAPRTRACNGCGTENDTDARFCKNCGRPLEVAGEAKS